MTTPTALDLMAFVDGELADERVEMMLQALSQDPSIAAQLLDQRRYKAACQRAGTSLLNDAAGGCPPELAAKLREITAATQAATQATAQAKTEASLEPESVATGTKVTPGDGPIVTPSLVPETADATQTVPPSQSMADRNDAPSPLARIGFWGPLAAAAVLAIGVFLGSAISQQEPVSVDNLLPASMVTQMSQRHITCADDPTELIGDSSLPGNSTELPRALQTRYGGIGVTGLDLSSAGYQFEAVGKCSIPGGDAVHLIYQSLPDSGFTDTVSLWIRPLPEDGDSELVEGRVHMIKQDNCASVYVWTQGKMIYYLAGDNDEHCSTVVETMTGQDI